MLTTVNLKQTKKSHHSFVTFSAQSTKLESAADYLDLLSK